MPLTLQTMFTLTSLLEIIFIIVSLSFFPLLQGTLYHKQNKYV